jgi:dihydroflavonol-4-reductase
MHVTVTGATGFLGGNLIRALLEAGIDVRAAGRRRGPSLEDLDVEFVPVDVLVPESLHAAFAGSDAVFHLAAMISITGDPTGEVWRVNVEGARNAARVALEQGVTRFVHCSSIHAFDLERCGPALDESKPRTTADHAPAYDRSKYAGEQAIRRVIADGLDAVIVNPTGMIGPHDYGPSLLGRTLEYFQRTRIPVTAGGGFDFVDVRDVAAGMLAALKLGRTGENYLLSGTRVSTKELGTLVADSSDATRPRVAVPVGLLVPFAPLVLRLTPRRKTPLFTPDSLHALRYSPTVSHRKASTELGYVNRPIGETVRDTVAWFETRRSLPQASPR